MEFKSGAVSPVGSIEKGWNLIKDDYWIFFGMSAVAIVILIILALIFGAINQGITVGMLLATSGSSSLDPETLRTGLPLVPQLVSMVISLVTNVLLVSLSGVLFCGIYAALDKKMREGVADFGMLFSQFSKLVPCAIFAALMSIYQFVLGVIVLLAALALGLGTAGLGGMLRGGLNESAIGAVILIFVGVVILGLIVNIIVAILTIFVYPLIAARGLAIGDAIVTSARAGLGNFGGLFLLALLMGLMFIGGFLACLIGMLFVAPLYTASQYAAFCDVFGIEAGSRSNEPPPPPVWNNPVGFQSGV
jgi:hypothetical protein